MKTRAMERNRLDDDPYDQYAPTPGASFDNPFRGSGSYRQFEWAKEHPRIANPLADLLGYVGMVLPGRAPARMLRPLNSQRPLTAAEQEMDAVYRRLLDTPSWGSSEPFRTPSGPARRAADPPSFYDMWEQQSRNPDKRPASAAQQVERPIAAATRYNGDIFTGATHGETVPAALAKYPEAERFLLDTVEGQNAHGFVTPSGEFLTRAEALARADAAGWDITRGRNMGLDAVELRANAEKNK